MTSHEVFEEVNKGNLDFYDHISKRKITLCAYDFEDGCTGYADVWDKKSEDHEYVARVDLSMLSLLED